MADTIAGVALAEIAQESLPFFTNTFAPLNAITTDFSSSHQSRGSTVTTRVPTAVTASDLSSGYSAAVQDTALTAYTITLSNFKGPVIDFTDLEMTRSALDLHELFISPCVDAIGASMFGTVWDLVNDTNLPAATATETTITAANFDRDDLVDVAKILTDNKCPRTGRFAFLSTAYYAALAKDLNSVDTAGSNNILNENNIPRIAGFDIYESALADGNSVNVGAFLGHKSAMLMAAAPIYVPPNEYRGGLQVENVTVPGLGLPIQMRRWYSADGGKMYMSMSCLWGVLWGLTTGGHKIVSA